MTLKIRLLTRKRYYVGPACKVAAAAAAGVHFAYRSPDGIYTFFFFFHAAAAALARSAATLCASSSNATRRRRELNSRFAPDVPTTRAARAPPDRRSKSVSRKVRGLGSFFGCRRSRASRAGFRHSRDTPAEPQRRPPDRTARCPRPVDRTSGGCPSAAARSHVAAYRVRDRRAVGRVHRVQHGRPAVVLAHGQGPAGADARVRRGPESAGDARVAGTRSARAGRPLRRRGRVQGRAGRQARVAHGRLRLVQHTRQVSSSPRIKTMAVGWVRTFPVSIGRGAGCLKSSETYISRR